VSARPLRLARLPIALAVALCLLPRPGLANPTTGAWSEVLDWPITAIHMVQLYTGEILVWSSKNQEPHLLDPTGDCFDVAGGCFTEKPNPVNIFCAGHTQLDDGTVIVNGGHRTNNVGHPDTFLFQHDKHTGEWSWTSVGEIEDTDFARWYPTLTTLPDGRVLNVSGSRLRCSAGPNAGELCVEHADCGPPPTEDCNHAFLVPVPELYDPADRTWTQLPGIAESVEFYPFNFVDPNGDVFFAGADDGAGTWDKAPTQSVIFDVDNQLLTDDAVSTHDGGSAVMYGPGLILKTGGTNGGSGAIADAEIIDLIGGGGWGNAAAMNIARRRHNLTVLPDGTVLVTGGTRLANREFETDRTCGGDAAGTPCCRDRNCPEGVTCQPFSSGEQQWVAEAEIWDPNADSWTVMASAQVPRMYHSTAILLPDGRVLSAGGGRGGCAINSYTNAEIFSPPYKFIDAPEPTITDAPEIIHYGESFEVRSPEAADVDRVTLIKLAAVTHSFDQNRRFLELTFNPVGDIGLEIEAPANANLAPPGFYMLFLLSSEGVPSVARFVRLLPADPGGDALYEYTAKVVCGSQASNEEPRAAPGHYSTSINIHNPGPGPTRFFKKLALTYPPGDQRRGEVLPIGEHQLAYDEALQSDCRDLRRQLIPGGDAPYFEGFLVVQSHASLDVTSVYSTAVAGADGEPTTHTSVDIEQIEERERGSDLRITKNVAKLTVPLNDNWNVVYLLYGIRIDNTGPEAALGVRVDDEIRLHGLTNLGAIVVYDDPIQLPPGGQIVDITYGDLIFGLLPTSVSFGLELGDLAAGDQLEAFFLAASLLYRTSAVVRNTATASAEGGEPTPLNNTTQVDLPIP
jgi:hypothetical protein